jgi:glycosyltransferase involved in cell wall biosynthesis
VTADKQKEFDGGSIWIVIAAFNEAAVIGPIISDVVRRNYRVAVIDDGSQDATGQIALDA